MAVTLTDEEFAAVYEALEPAASNYDNDGAIRLVILEHQAFEILKARKADLDEAPPAGEVGPET